jgi:hypothetical protein
MGDADVHGISGWRQPRGETQPQQPPSRPMDGKEGEEEETAASTPTALIE